MFSVVIRERKLFIKKRSYFNAKEDEAILNKYGHIPFS